METVSVSEMETEHTHRFASISAHAATTACESAAANATLNNSKSNFA
jgi:hypothetical protein